MPKKIRKNVCKERRQIININKIKEIADDNRKTFQIEGTLFILFCLVCFILQSYQKYIIDFLWIGLILAVFIIISKIEYRYWNTKYYFYKELERRRK